MKERGRSPGAWGDLSGRLSFTGSIPYRVELNHVLPPGGNAAIADIQRCPLDAPLSQVLDRPTKDAPRPAHSFTSRAPMISPNRIQVSFVVRLKLADSIRLRTRILLSLKAFESPTTRQARHMIRSIAVRHRTQNEYFEPWNFDEVWTYSSDHVGEQAAELAFPGLGIFILRGLPNKTFLNSCLFLFG